MAEWKTNNAGSGTEETGYMHSGMNKCSWRIARPPATRQPDQETIWQLLKLNALLDMDARLSRFNERVLEKRLNQLDRIGGSQDAVYGLTLGRINELALLCAGNYADHAEVQGVGDLLFNPRRILVYIKGMPGPVTKVRHAGLTEQFAHVAETRGGVVAWLRDKTVTEIQLPPLLPSLYARLLESRAISQQ